tara:strand:+ start:505 stop:849 length:345 start_codon:yes stop_codon:yes gene_type:complete
MEGCDLVAGPVDTATCEDLCESQATKTEVGTLTVFERCSETYEEYLSCVAAVDWSAQICNPDNELDMECEEQYRSWELFCEPCDDGYEKEEDGNCYSACEDGYTLGDDGNCYET